MCRYKSPIFFPLVIFWSLLAFPVSAENLYQSCAVCHGNAAQGDATFSAPALAGQSEAYLARQLRHFRDGVRGAGADDPQGVQMAVIAESLSGEDISSLAAYLAGLAPLPVTGVDGDLKNGSKLYQGNCGACHGASGEGNPSLNAPALAWLDATYIRRQIANFQGGLRGSHRDDRYGRQMSLMATGLTPRDLRDIVAYLQSRVRE